MQKVVLGLLALFASLPLSAQDAAAGRFAGTWEAKFKDKVICTIRVKAGDPMSGETANCNIQVDGNGDLEESEGSAAGGEAVEMIEPTVNGDSLSFSEKDGDDILKFTLKLTGDGQAELSILNAPIAIKPIRFAKK